MADRRLMDEQQRHERGGTSPATPSTNTRRAFSRMTSDTLNSPRHDVTPGNGGKPPSVPPGQHGGRRCPAEDDGRVPRVTAFERVSAAIAVVAACRRSDPHQPDDALRPATLDRGSRRRPPVAAPRHGPGGGRRRRHRRPRQRPHRAVADDGMAAAVTMSTLVGVSMRVDDQLIDERLLGVPAPGSMSVPSSSAWVPSARCCGHVWPVTSVRSPSSPAS